MRPILWFFLGLLVVSHYSFRMDGSFSFPSKFDKDCCDFMGVVLQI